MLTQTPRSREADVRAQDAVGDPAEQLLALMDATAGHEADGSPAPSYRRFLDTFGVAVYTADADGRITYYNDAAATMWGRAPEHGELWCGSWRLYWPDGRRMQHDECPMAMTLREKRPVRGYEAMAERPDGSRVWFQPFPSPLLDEAGEMIGAVNVMVDVTERKRAEDALRATADALASSSSVKDEFLGLVSHELRTPVTTIFGNARLLRDRAGKLDDETQSSMVGDIAGEAERLLAIVENLLLLTRLGSGGAPDPEPHIVDRVVRSAVESYRSRHPDRRIVLRVGHKQAIVEAARAYLEALLENLIGNADKYSPPDALIEVSVRIRDDIAEVLVRDRGIGITDDEDQLLFTPFFRGARARSLGNGVGIGLTVCRRLVEGLGGRMWARSRRGGGSEFGFALPLAGDAG